MKKILRLTATILSVLTLTACSSKKNDIELVPDAPDEPAVEQPFQEIYAENFTTINVPINVMEGNAPVEVMRFDINDFDFGEKLPPCKAEDVREQFNPHYENYLNINSNIDESDAAAYEKSLETPAKGSIRAFRSDGKNLYFIVNYDFYCTENAHEWSVFMCDTETEELTELYSYSGIDDEPRYVHNLYIDPDGVLYLRANSEGEGHIYAVDSEANKLNEIYSGSSADFLDNSAGRVIIQEIEFGDLDAADHVTLLDYDHKTGELNEIYSTDLSSEEWQLRNNNRYAYGEILAWTEKPEGSRKYDVVSDYYRFSTGLTNAHVIYASKDRVIVMSNNGTEFIGNNVREIHCFDFDKKEHYVLDVNAYGSFISAADGNLIFGPYIDSYYIDQISPLWYIIPEHGFAFKLANIDGYVMPQQVDGTMCFIEQDFYTETDDNMLYVITDKESE